VIKVTRDVLVSNYTNGLRTIENAAALIKQLEATAKIDVVWRYDRLQIYEFERDHAGFLFEVFVEGRFVKVTDHSKAQIKDVDGDPRSVIDLAANLTNEQRGHDLASFICNRLGDAVKSNRAFWKVKSMANGEFNA
jgi:hypothetical protein